MVKHGSGTRWPDDREVERHCVRSTPCIRRRGARVSWFSLKTKVDGFSRFGLKTKWAMVCRLRHKTDGRINTTRDTQRDLAAYFTYK
jgi:hypothetical protein